MASRVTGTNPCTVLWQDETKCKGNKLCSYRKPASNGGRRAVCARKSVALPPPARSPSPKQKRAMSPVAPAGPQSRKKSAMISAAYRVQPLPRNPVSEQLPDLLQHFEAAHTLGMMGSNYYWPKVSKQTERLIAKWGPESILDTLRQWWPQADLEDVVKYAGVEPDSVYLNYQQDPEIAWQALRDFIGAAVQKWGWPYQ